MQSTPSSDATAAPKTNRRRRPSILCGVAIFLAPLVVGWPYLGAEGSITPDGIDYVNIARNVARGRGFLHTIKWHYFDDRPVVCPAWGERMPMYPLFLTPMVAVGAGPRAMGAANLALLGLAALLAAGLARRLVRGMAPAAGATDGVAGPSGEMAALGAGFTVGLAPVALFWGSYPLTEPLFLALLFAALGLAVDLPERSRGAGWRAALCGVIACLAYLTRSTGMAIPAAALIWLGARRAWRPAMALAVGFGVPFLLWAAVLKATRGSFGYNMQNFHMIVGNFAEEMGQSFGREYPTAGQFVSDHAAAVGRAIRQNALQYMQDLFSPGLLGVWTLLAGLALVGGLGRPAAGLLGLFAALNWALAASVWSTQEGARFMIPSFAALAVAAAAGAQSALAHRRWLRFAPLGALACALAIYAPQIGDHWKMSAQTRNRPLELSAAERMWLERSIPEMAAVGTDMPFEVNLLCDRPTAWTQWDNPRFSLAAMMERYDVEYLALTPDAAARLRADAVALALAAPLGFGPMGMEWFAVGQGK